MTATPRMVDMTNADYHRALNAEPRLQPAVALVDALTVLVRPSDRVCAGCVWTGILKPMVSRLIGYGRGYPPKVAPNPRFGPRRLVVVSMADALAQLERRVPADTETERWLRTSEAWDAFNRPLLARLHAADPGNGHGIGRHV